MTAGTKMKLNGEGEHAGKIKGRISSLFPFLTSYAWYSLKSGMKISFWFDP